MTFSVFLVVSGLIFVVAFLMGVTFGVYKERFYPTYKRVGLIRNVDEHKLW